ncbi:uncharacterized protein LOC143148961 isoform X2 [Ptiloglossa arizonensis]|uniref:uncharacterized protein LOC143148961 isoform X2 n=1 Tax=Ptiloglossa arizonensis TaxID=3350558 RepID=UPI003F9F8969
MKRSPWTFAFLRALLLTSLLSSSLSVSARARGGKKKVAEETKEANVCEIEDQGVPIYCYCNENGPGNATDAKCVVLSALVPNDPVWDYFDSQIHLRELKVDVKTVDALDHLPAQMLRRFKELRKITFRYAKIDEVAEHAFSNLSTIAEIDLDKNSIYALKTRAFESMRNLSVVSLNENRITEINRDTFVDLPSIKSLFLARNNVSTLHDKAFKHLTTLEELELSDNRIEVITGDSFHGLRSLLRLDLRNNLIDMIGARTFVEMPLLRELELDSNKIVYVSEKALDGLRNLRKLGLGENELATLEPDFLAGAPAVHFLDLGNNRLKTVTFDNVKPVVTNMYNGTSHFYLSGNKLICDCKLAWIWGLRNETKNRQLRDALEKLTCFLESNNASRKINNVNHEWNKALENARNPKEYLAENFRAGNLEVDNAYLGDEYDSEGGYEDSNSDSQPKGMFSATHGKGQVCLLFFLQIVLIAIMGALVTYGPEANANLPKDRAGDHEVWLSAKKPGNNDSFDVYPMYQDVHVMIWIGFGFLMTFLKRYGQSALGFTFLIGALLVQVAMVCEGVANMKKDNKVYLSLESLLSADVAVAAPLISMGALLGKTTYAQLLFMGIIELIAFTANKYVGERLLVAVDAGDSMFVHAFGAYFGLAVSFVLGTRKRPKEHHLEGPSYNSDMFAMIGTMFLWLFWPSFNSAALEGDRRQRAIVNTLLSISASCAISFATSALVSKDSKFNTVHVQNSTLAGGVAIGTAAGMMCEPVGALIVGSMAGLLSVLGYKYLTPLIQKRLRIHDTCGVHNLHGIPGVLGGIFGALMAGLATEASYDYSLYEIFPARAPNSETKLAEMRDNYDVSPGLDRTAGQQASYQLLALAITVGIAIVSGLVTGLMMRASVCGSILEEHKFNDEAHWELEEESSQESKIKDEHNSGDQLPMGSV